MLLPVLLSGACRVLLSTQDVMLDGVDYEAAQMSRGDALLKGC
jgi:hypothetical protein